MTKNDRTVFEEASQAFSEILTMRTKMDELKYVL